MKLNDEQKRAVGCDASACISACPGSGKTRTIIAKIIRCVDDVKDTSRRVACITYTHAAVSEIEKRLREYGDSDDHDYCEIGTIHSFCLNNVLRPFHYRLPELSGGFDVFPPDSDEWRELTRRIGDRHGVKPRYREYFNHVKREPDGSLFHPSAIPEAAAEEFITHVDGHALVTFADIVYHSYRLVDSCAFIARGLANRFAWMLIDEFQDTSRGQVAILRGIAVYGKTRFFMVGDPNQSIMGFAGAHPDLMSSFPAEIEARTDLSLSGNYRCSSNIVDDAENLIPAMPKMHAVGPTRDFGQDTVYVHGSSIAECVLNYFLPAVDKLGIPLGEAAVLAPWWTTLYGLARDLREHGIPIRGPGARPYRFSNLFASLAEHLCAYIEQSDVDLFGAMQRSLFITLLNMTAGTVWDVYSYRGRLCLCQMVHRVRDCRDADESAVAWLRSASVAAAEILIEGELVTEAQGALLPESAEAMIANMVANRVDIENLSTEELALYARPKDCLRLISMHGAKGMEFDAVAVADLHEGRIPDFRAIRDGDTESIEEDKRQLYVAMTRPRKLLMYCTDQGDWRNKPSRFLAGMGVTG